MQTVQYVNFFELPKKIVVFEATVQLKWLRDNLELGTLSFDSFRKHIK
jgi:hypothetical protein